MSPAHLQLGYKADHFSGADLGALLAEAQLAAVHEVLEGSEPGAEAAARAPAGGKPAAADEPVGGGSSGSSGAGEAGTAAGPAGREAAGGSGSSGDRAAAAAQQAPAAQRPPAAPAPHQAVVLQQRHLEAALETARPSVPEAERERLDAIYGRFRADRRPGGAAAADKGKGKVTWA